MRNYQARNFMRDEMQVGDGVLFYASNADPSGVTGLAEIARAGYPDPFAFKKGHTYFDPESRKDEPIWYTVDVEFVERFPAIVPLDVLKTTRGLEQMVVTQKGQPAVGAAGRRRASTRSSSSWVAPPVDRSRPCRSPISAPSSISCAAMATSSSSRRRSTPTSRPPRSTGA